jgi:hypothetical protein
MPRKRPSEHTPAVQRPLDLLDSIRALSRLAAADETHDLQVAERLQQIVAVAGLGQPGQEPVGLDHRDWNHGTRG